jgi:murein L,D-transpeptidase YafK
MNIWWRTAALAACLTASALQAAEPRARQPEPQLLAALDKVRSNQLDAALHDVDVLLQEQPNFQLARLVYADLMLAKAGPLRGLGNAEDTPDKRLEQLRREAQARLQARQSPPPANHLPSILWQLAPEIPSALVVDSAHSRLYLFENGPDGPRHAADYYVTIGKNGAGKQVRGDGKSPLGVYVITSEIPRTKLSDFYGAGALPLDYPNPWDLRLGRTGDGIWLHGVPSNTYSRAPQASDGCVVLANADFEDLRARIRPGVTPVIVSPRVEWQPREQVLRSGRDFQAALEQWRRDWESRDSSRYLRHYSKAFQADGKSYAAWAEHKRRVNAAKQYIKVGLKQVSAVNYPGEQELVAVDFEQSYQSNNLNSQTRKRQYWRKEGDGQWRIVYEG